MELSAGAVAVLCATGFAAGVVNTIAGGGSNLTVPALMMLGMPADIANGTNRVAVLLQSAAGAAAFDRRGMLDRPAALPVLLPAVGGGAVGAALAALLPNLYLKPVLLLSILLMSAAILALPDADAPPPGAPGPSPAGRRGAWWGLFAAGVYGGFAQAGVGFLLLGALVGCLRYDLMRANALKLVCSLAFTAVSLAVFAAFGQVRWLPGLVLAAGAAAGSLAAVRVAAGLSRRGVKRFLFLMTLCAVTGGFLL